MSDEKRVEIIPFNSACADLFETVKNDIACKLSPTLLLEHHGASSLGISGQDEIDAYLPVAADKFDETVRLVETLYGEPQSYYAAERARFVTVLRGKHIDIFVINNECSGWKDGVRFENYLRTHPTTLKQYEKLKESVAGQSVRAYYREKIEFINQILATAKNF